MKEIINRFTGHFQNIPKSRKSTSRSPNVIRAKVVHTSHNKRRLEVFIPKNIWMPLGWKMGGKILVQCSENGCIRLSPAHDGVLANPTKDSTTTLRIVISGDIIRKSICSPSRNIEFQVDSQSLFIQLPDEWINEAALDDMKRLAEAA